MYFRYKSGHPASHQRRRNRQIDRTPTHRPGLEQPNRQERQSGLAPRLLGRGDLLRNIGSLPALRQRHPSRDLYVQIKTSKLVPEIYRRKHTINR